MVKSRGNIVTAEWINRAKELDLGETIWLQFDNATQRKAYLKLFREELEGMMTFDAASAAKIRIVLQTKGAVFWLGLTKVVGSPFVGVKKDLNGKRTRIELDDEMRRKSIQQLANEGATDMEIAGIFGDLSKADRKLIKECRDAKSKKTGNYVGGASEPKTIGHDGGDGPGSTEVEG